MNQNAPLRDQLIQFDKDSSKLKIARFYGEIVSLEVTRGCVTLGTDRYYVSNNLLDGSIISCNVVRSRDPDVHTSLLVRDVLKYGSSDLAAVTYGSRHELLDLLGSSFPADYGFAIFGGRCIAPNVYVAIPTTFSLAAKCLDSRLIGVSVIESAEFGDGEDVPVIAEYSGDDDVDGLKRFPPVENEAKRVLGYKNMIQMHIKKICGKWRDAYLSRHTPSQLPYSAEDLMQLGYMEVTIALRKYNSSHASQAKEATFVYRHIWNRFGHLAHKYSKQSRGYGVHLVRDFIDEDGNLTPSYELNNRD